MPIKTHLCSWLFSSLSSLRHPQHHLYTSRNRWRLCHLTASLHFTWLWHDNQYKGVDLENASNTHDNLESLKPNLYKKQDKESIWCTLKPYFIFLLTPCSNLNIKVFFTRTPSWARRTTECRELHHLTVFLTEFHRYSLINTVSSIWSQFH